MQDQLNQTGHRPDISKLKTIAQEAKKAREDWQKEPSQLDRIEQKLDILLQRTEPKKKPKQTKIKDTRTLEEQIKPHVGKYPPREIIKFVSYWGEGNRWQKEKTWEIDKRLRRWMMNVEDREWEKTQRQIVKKTEERPVSIERVSGTLEINEGFKPIGNLFNR